MNDISLHILVLIAIFIGWLLGRHSVRKVTPTPKTRQSLSEEYFRGLDFLINEQSDKAIDVFVQNLEVNQDTIDTHLALGKMFCRRGEVDRAILIHKNLLDTSGLDQKQRFNVLLELANDYLNNSKSKVKLILKGIKNNTYNYEGAFGAALEEYIEAELFYLYIKGKDINILEQVSLDYFDAYISGLCDFTGELARRCVRKGAQRDIAEVEHMRDIVEKIYQQLSKFSLTGKLRSKYDELKRNLYRMEEIVYDLKIREN